MMKKEKDILLQEIHHRVRNNLQIIESLLHLQASKINDSRYLDLFFSYFRRIHTIASVENSLYSEQCLSSISFQSFIPRLVESLRTHLHKKPDDVTVRYKIDKIKIDINRAIPCALIINEAVSNAMMYAFPGGSKGTIMIRFQKMKNDRSCLLEIWDNGVGLPSGIDIGRPQTLGLELIKILSEQINGNLVVTRHNGTKYSIIFPYRHRHGNFLARFFYRIRFNNAILTETL